MASVTACISSLARVALGTLARRGLDGRSDAGSAGGVWGIQGADGGWKGGCELRPLERKNALPGTEAERSPLTSVAEVMNSSGS